MDKDIFYDLLTKQFFELRVEWKLYRSLFGTNENTVQMLNAISGPTAATLERVLFERVLLGLRKLTENFKNRRGNKSVSLEGLRHIGFADSAEIDRLVEDAKQSAAFAKEWSDKRIAHADLDHAAGAKTLTGANRAKVESAMECIAKTIRYVSLKNYNLHQVTHPLAPINDELEFLRALYLGLTQMELLDEAMVESQLSRDVTKIKELRAERNEIPDWLTRIDPPIDI